MKEGIITLFITEINIPVYSSIRVKSGVSVSNRQRQDGEGETKTDCHIDPLLLLLTIQRYVIFEALHLCFSRFLPGAT